MHAVMSSLADLVYPRLCAVCHDWVGAGGHTLCWECRSRLRWITPPFCRLCGDPAEGVATHAYECGFCKKRPPAFVSARSLLRYDGVCSILIQKFKYGNACWTSAEMAQWLETGARLHFPVHRIDCIMAVPLSPRKQRERSYNQAGLLGRDLARRLHLPCRAGLVRCHDTMSQTHLNMVSRRRNVRGAFAARIPEWIRGRRILVVDDVMTTGATLDECARILRRAGAVSVYALTVARG